MSWCSKCQTNKAPDEFAKGERPDGTNYYCKSCNKVYRDGRKTQIRNYQLQYHFGISLDEYNQISQDQHNVCVLFVRDLVVQGVH
jgi:hypothetical protein